MAQPQSRFIVLEGIDGAGTTTQTRRLAQRLRQQGCPVVTTCEPSSGPVGNLIRQALERRLRVNGDEAIELDWATLALLFAADRTDHVSRCIEPALRSGAYVICDRYDLSSFIYQSLTAPDPEQALRWVRELNGQLRRPDITLVLDVNPDIAEIRRAKRGTEPELFERRSLQQRLAVAYQDSQNYVPNDRLVHVDGAVSAAEVTERLYALVLA
jgi:dTMP kinase